MEKSLSDWINSGGAGQTKEWKDGIRNAGLSTGSAVLILVITALFRGEDLRGLSRLAAFLHVLEIGVPLWVFLIVLVVGSLAITHWIQTIFSRKETLRVVWRPEHCLWGQGAHGDKPIMQVLASGYLTNVATDRRLIIISAYLSGTKPVLGMFEPIQLEAAHCQQERVDCYVEPLTVKKGATYKGKMILVDQFGVKHKVPIELRSMQPKDAVRPEDQLKPNPNTIKSAS